MTHVHPSAIVDKRATIGDNVTIGAFSIVEGDVVIGDGTSIASHTLIADGARIGQNCKIHKGAVVATIPQDLKFTFESSTFEIGDNTTVREFCTLNRGTKERGKSSVGRNCLLMAYVHVAHDCFIGNNVILANCVQVAGHVDIEDFVIMGGLTGIHQFVRIGQHAMVGGGLRVVKDVPPYILAMGEPLQYGGINSVGLRRRGFTSDSLMIMKRAYRLLYRSKLNVSQAVERIKNEIEITPEIQNIIRFIEKADRGLI
ncbi:acyl-ACP--UDP-N-acetylglucosamine O-acyltransferase [candidate division KSB1 bacterium]|nr:acyl-ACP--UDP-N-acetylglucosamine O-acyltransferase [candidate division KSB1 bacterium]RQW05746.1 MAG: acyl-ACP--UDP-N-acetylglucosamine O-acyltransferase [candidate division KSB1 bacterium]